MKHIKKFENVYSIKEGKYVKFNANIKFNLDDYDEIFRIDSISEPTLQVWVKSLETNNHHWILLKNLRLLTELELNALKYNI